MRLKKLTIFGFKSFAEKVVLDFDCEIIGIVGPNGCGKSNIVDAFRWVMGEQSAKSLRGDKMHDVLFAGTDHRKPLNYAEVSVTLTDIENALPIAYEEVTVTRRLYRSGESEYFLNKEQIRLKDLQTLFLGSGIGKNAFSIFEQGELDRIIHLSPLERRSIFDEAAGVSRFLLRKKETVRKLTAVNDNLTRVRDVHGEIEKQTKQLKKQASHAKSYQENATRLQELEKSVLIARFCAIETKNKDANEKLSALNQVLKEASVEMALLEEALTQAKQELIQEEQKARQGHKSFSAAETKLRVNEAEITQARQRVLEIKKREETIQLHLLELKKEETKASAEISKKEATLLSLSSDADLKESIKIQRQAHVKHLQDEGKLNAEIKEKCYRYETKIGRLKALSEGEKTQTEALKKETSRIALQQEKVKTLSATIDSFKVENHQLESEVQLLRKRLAEDQKQQQSYLRQITEAEGHEKAISKLKEEMEGFSSGAKTLLKEAKNEKSALYGKIEPLVDYLIPRKGYEALLASSLKGYADTLVVESEEHFEELLALAEKKKITDFSVVIKSRVDRKESAKKKNVLYSQVEKNSVAHHFTAHFEITEAGHFYDALGVFFFFSKTKTPNNTFFREAELKTLKETLVALREKANAHLALSEKVAEELKAKEKRRNELAEIRRKKEMELIAENFALQQAMSDVEKINQTMALHKKEKESLSPLENDAKEIEELKRRLHEIKTQAEQLLSTLQHQETLFEKWQEIHQQIQILKAKQQQNALHEKKMLEELKELSGRIELTVANIAKQENEHEEQLIILEKQRAQLKSDEEHVVEAKKICQLKENELTQKRKQQTTIEKQAHGQEIILAKELSEKTSIEETLAERHGLTAEGLQKESVLPHFDVEEASKEIQRLRISLESAGAVNMTAIDAFKETQERFEYLDQQLKDLEESKKDLEEIISKLDQESRKIFKKTFQQIRENFQKNFAILFNGGSADLSFTESSDILEAGVEIVAKPPGKQMKAISLLSGGEKCLTALALLFSIFEVRPAPFCILDEVDAPLDDSNIDRFTRVLKQFIDKTQFIVVTHNKKTMAIADLLIGVSMEEKGVSKLISLSFEKHITPAKEYV